MTPAAYAAIAVTLAVIGAAAIAGALIERPRNTWGKKTIRLIAISRAIRRIK